VDLTRILEKLVREEWAEIKVQRGFLGLVAIGDETGQQMDEEVERAAVGECSICRCS
jgi:hypothetical protein